MATTTKKRASIVTPEIPRIQDVPIFKPDIPETPASNGNQVAQIKFTYPAKKNISPDGTILIPLSSLVSLDQTTIPNAEAAMRELDENNVYQFFLAYEAGRPVPPVLVQQSSEGNILIGGYHRRAAMSRLFTQLNTNPDMPIQVKPAHFTTAREVLNAAYIDNFSNGLGASYTSRSRYALQLLAWDKEDGYPDGKPMSLHKAAALAGITHQAVMKMRDKLAGRVKTKKMVDTLLSPEDQAEYEAYQADRAETAKEETTVSSPDPQAALSKAVKQMFTSLAQIYALNKNINELATHFRNYVGKDDTDMVATLSLALQAVTMDRNFGIPPNITK